MQSLPKMYKVRLWSTKRARMMEVLYAALEKALLLTAPVLERIGYARLEKPVAVIEKTVKGFLFDCQMCGQCALSKTGMSCPMNCPKSIRNGPCGGVRANGNCEVKPEMKCVWVEAWDGASRMQGGSKIHEVQFATNKAQLGTSAWLRMIKEQQQEKELAASKSEVG